jgi:crotonobetainyl-CoA:carnitine CoA-transferase CaiB-like acyl-CoA transferase
MSELLADVRVLDLSDERGALCGQLLADLGADVVRVEPPGGSPMRASVLWDVHARNCASLVLDLGDAAHRDRFAELAADADVVVESGNAATLDLDALRARHPRLVHVAITPFGRTGPKADYVATDLVVQAAAGAMAITGFADDRPLRTGCVTAWSHAGVAAAGGALLALRQRQRTGRGQLVDVSAQLACNLSASYSLLTSHIGASRIRRMADTPGAFPYVWPVRDGFVSMTLGFAGPMLGFAKSLFAWMAREGELEASLATMDWPAHLASLRSGGDPAPLARLRECIAAFLGARTKADLLAGAIANGVLIVPVSTMSELLESPQLEDRGFFWRSGDLTVPGAFARFSTEPIRLRARAPALDAHAPGVFRPRAAPLASFASSARDGLPLDGINVLDFSWVMAGPWSTRVLADYGATVVKIESRTKLDLVRILGPFYGDKVTPETSASFASINAGKRSFEVDPNTPEGKATILDLVDWADVVVESFSPKAMKKWGLDWEVLSARKPGLVMLSTCLFGQTGPYARMAGYGTMGAALGGLVQPTGIPGRPPCGPFGPYTDYVAPRFSVVALLAALHHRDRTGRGQYVDQSQAESAMHFLGRALADAARGAQDPDRLGNSDAEFAPHDVFRCAGDDQWVAIAVRDARDWLALADEMGIARAEAGRWIDRDARRNAEAEIGRRIGAWTADQAAADVEARLQKRGVPAHAVANAGADPDPQLVHREHFVRCAHALHGEVRVESVGYRFSDMSASVGRVPSLGGDGDAIRRDILGS